MGLFFDILSAINNPNQQASVSELESVTNTINQVANNNNLNANQMQNVLSTLGNVLRPALQEQRTTVGGGQLDNVLGQLAGAGGLASLSSMITPQLQQQLVQAVAQKTGLNAGMIQTILPTLIPAVLSFLNLGAPKSGVSGSNPVLNAFLDSDRDGDVDLGDVMKFSTRFLK